MTFNHRGDNYLEIFRELIKSALDPVIEQTLKDHPQHPTQALLNLTVCDPACGSGHFLLAAARRLAEVLAKLRASDGNPTRDDYRHALREVVGRCIYGVDKNPLAIELAKTALWLESYTPDRPLNFLDHHLRCGDALLGVLDPKILEEGIPEKAFDPLSGDDKEVAKRLKAENRAALKSLKKLKSADLFAQSDVRQAAETLESLPDETLPDIEQKRARWQNQTAQVHDTLAAKLADTYVAAFLMPKVEQHAPTIPLTGYFWALSQGEQNEADSLAKLSEAARFCRSHQVFHWCLEFPHIFSPRPSLPPSPSGESEARAAKPAGEGNPVEARNPLPAGEGRVRAKAPNVSICSSQERSALALTPTPLPQGEGLNSTPLSDGNEAALRAGGFSVLLGNPPWERIKLQEEEFFASRSPLVAEAQHKAERAKRIQLLQKGMLLHAVYPEQERAQNLTPPNQAEINLYEEFIAARRGAEAASLFAHDSKRYPLTGVGDVNTYALFAETFSQLVAPNGRAGFIVPTGIATDDSTKAYFAAMSQSGMLSSILSFENEEFIFPAVHHAYRFSLFTLRGNALGNDPATLVFFARQPSQIHESSRQFKLTPEEFQLINPNTRTCPVFRSQMDAELTNKIYRNVPVLIREDETS